MHNAQPPAEVTLGPGAWPRTSAFLVRWRWSLLGLGLTAAVLAYFPAQRLAFDRSIENMFAPHDPILAPYQQLKRTFGGNEIALAAYVDAQLLTPAGMDRLQALTGELAEVPGVANAFSLSTSPFGKYIISLPLREPFLKLSEGYTISADHQTAGVVCVLLPEHDSPIPRSETVDRMRAIVIRHQPEGVLTGEPVMVVDGFRYLDEDGRRLGLAATLLLGLVIALCFRSLRWVIVPMAVVYATLELTEALLVTSGLRMSMVSSMLWAIVAVIGIGTTVHVIVSFRDSRAAGMTPKGAILLAGGLLGAPVMWACLTDAAGFGSLLVSSVGPVHDFGTMMAIGSLVTLLCIAVLVPGLALLGSIDADPKRAWGERGIDVGLSKLSGLIQRRPMLVALVAAAVTLPPMVGIAWLDVETDFTKNFRRHSPIVRAYDFVESHLGGAGVWDVIVPLPSQNDPEFFPRIRRLEDRLRTEVVLPNDQGGESPGLTKVLSVVDALDVISFSPGRSNIESAKLESTLVELKKVMPIVATLHGRDPESGNREFLRIMLRSAERQPSAQKRSLIEQVTRISVEEFPETETQPAAQVTGFFVLLTRLIESMLRDQWSTFAVATVGIWLMMLAAFRSLPLSLVALVPNALPILVVTGLLGWTGLRINMGAAMIAAVSMGLSVDSSVHYITAFRRHRWRGCSVDEAIARVHQSVGRAMVFSTLALIVGFTALCLSQFVPTIYFGVLMGLAMLGGMLGNLVVLPLLLKLLSRQERPAGGANAVNQRTTHAAAGGHQIVSDGSRSQV